jgi:hypothetical protein
MIGSSQHLLDLKTILIGGIGYFAMFEKVSPTPFFMGEVSDATGGTV